MGERFRGPGRDVRFSNGAVEALYRKWVELGEVMAEDAEERAVVEWLRARLHGGGVGGWRAFRLDPPEPELASGPRLRFLARLVAVVGVELARGIPDEEFLPEVPWDDDLRLFWLERLDQLHAMIHEVMPTKADPMPWQGLPRRHRQEFP